MKYLKYFENYPDFKDNKKLQAVRYNSGEHENPVLNGELVDEDEEDITIPVNIEITGHIGIPVKKTQTQKLTKGPKIKNC